MAEKLTKAIAAVMGKKVYAKEMELGERWCVACVVSKAYGHIKKDECIEEAHHLLCVNCAPKFTEYQQYIIAAGVTALSSGLSYSRHCGAAAMFMRDDKGELLYDSSHIEQDAVPGPIYMDQKQDKDGAPVSFYGTSRLGKQPRRIAAEIEVAHTNGWNEEFFKTLKKWNCAVVGDGSLQRGRGKKGGSFEINTAPASGDKWAQMIADVCKDLRAIGGRANWSCGTHVHVDATKNFGWWDMRRLVRLYAKVEDGMYAIIDPSRKQSTYAIPCGEKLLKYFKKSEENPDVTPRTKIQKFKASIAMGMYGVDPKSLSNSRATSTKSHSSRYMALNLHSWFYRGTIEFRHSHGITHPEKITNWGLMCASIIDAASNLTEAQLDAVPPGVPGLVAIAPTDRVAKWILKREAKFKNFIPKPDPDRDEGAFIGEDDDGQDNNDDEETF